MSKVIESYIGPEDRRPKDIPPERSYRSIAEWEASVDGDLVKKGIIEKAVLGREPVPPLPIPPPHEEDFHD